MSRRQSCYINNRARSEKSTQPTANKRSQAPEKRPREATPQSLGNCLLPPPPPSEFLLPSVGNMDIFWNYTFKREMRNIEEQKKKENKKNS